MAKGQHLKEKDPKKSAPIWVKINLTVVISLFIGITVMLLFFERPTISLTEKRELAKFPEFSFESFFKGEYTEGVSNWFNDTVPFRDGFKDISANIMKNMGVTMGGVVINGAPIKVVTDSPVHTAPPDEQTGTQTGAPQQTENGSGENVTVPAVTEEAPVPTEADVEKPVGENAEVVNGQAIYQLNGHWWGVQLYGGGYNQDKYIKSVNAFAEDLDGIAKVYSMIPPTNGDFYCPEGFEDYNASQLKDIRYMEEGLSDKVTSVDCYTALSQHTDEYIYCRTDHHWQPLGAYYAAEQFAAAAGVPFTKMEGDNFTAVDIPDFVGSLYGTTGRAEMQDADTFTYYIPKNYYNDDFAGAYYYDMYYKDELKYPFFQKDQKGKNAYGVFMGGDNKIVRVDTDVKNGRTLLVFKDSYGNAEIPFYFGSFEHIYVCDVRYFGLNAVDFIKEHSVTDVLFTMCTFSAAGGNCDGIEMSRTGTGPYIH